MTLDADAYDMMWKVMSSEVDDVLWPDPRLISRGEEIDDINDDVRKMADIPYVCHRRRWSCGAFCVGCGGKCMVVIDVDIQTVKRTFKAHNPEIKADGELCI